MKDISKHFYPRLLGFPFGFKLPSSIKDVYLNARFYDAKETSYKGYIKITKKDDSLVIIFIRRYEQQNTFSTLFCSNQNDFQQSLKAMSRRDYHFPGSYRKEKQTYKIITPFDGKTYNLYYT